MSTAYKLYFILGSLFIIYLMASRYMANKIGDTIEPYGMLTFIWVRYCCIYFNGESSLVDIASKPF